MRNPVRQRGCQVAVRQQTVNDAGGESITATDPVVDLEVLAHASLVELAFGE